MTEVTTDSGVWGFGALSSDGRQHFDILFRQDPLFKRPITHTYTQLTEKDVCNKDNT